MSRRKPLLIVTICLQVFAQIVFAQVTSNGNFQLYLCKYLPDMDSVILCLFFEETPEDNIKEKIKH